MPVQHDMSQHAALPAVVGEGGGFTLSKPDNGPDKPAVPQLEMNQAGHYTITGAAQPATKYHAAIAPAPSCGGSSGNNTYSGLQQTGPEMCTPRYNEEMIGTFTTSEAAQQAYLTVRNSVTGSGLRPKDPKCLEVFEEATREVRESALANDCLLQQGPEESTPKPHAALPSVVGEGVGFTLVQPDNGHGQYEVSQPDKVQADQGAVAGARSAPNRQAAIPPAPSGDSGSGNNIFSGLHQTNAGTWTARFYRKVIGTFTTAEAAQHAYLTVRKAVTDSGLPVRVIDPKFLEIFDKAVREVREAALADGCLVAPGPPKETITKSGSRPLFRGITQTAAGTWQVMTKIAGARKTIGTFRSVEAASKAFECVRAKIEGSDLPSSDQKLLEIYEEAKKEARGAALASGLLVVCRPRILDSLPTIPTPTSIFGTNTAAFTERDEKETSQVELLRGCTTQLDSKALNDSPALKQLLVSLQGIHSAYAAPVEGKVARNDEGGKKRPARQTRKSSDADLELAEGDQMHTGKAPSRDNSGNNSRRRARGTVRGIKQTSTGAWTASYLQKTIGTFTTAEAASTAYETVRNKLVGSIFPSNNPLRLQIFENAKKEARDAALARGCLIESSSPTPNIQANAADISIEVTKEGANAEKRGRGRRRKNVDSFVSPFEELSKRRCRPRDSVDPRIEMARQTLAMQKQSAGPVEIAVQTIHCMPALGSEVDFNIHEPPMTPIVKESSMPVCNSKAELNEHDVLLGRGPGVTNQIGNQRFRDLVRDFQPTYLLAKKKEKSLLARSIVLIIRKRGGRFVKKNDETGGLHEIGDAKAEFKAAQALREGLDIRATKRNSECAAQRQSAVPVDVDIPSDGSTNMEVSLDQMPSGFSKKNDFTDDVAELAASILAERGAEKIDSSQPVHEEGEQCDYMHWYDEQDGVGTYLHQDPEEGSEWMMSDGDLDLAEVDQDLDLDLDPPEVDLDLAEV